MATTEKATYFVYQRGLDPAKLRLGNLVIFPANPQEKDPYICPHKTADLFNWTGAPQEDSDNVFNFQASRSSLAAITSAGLFRGEIGDGGSSLLHLEGKNGRRYQIDRATNFLNEVVLESPGAREWLKSRLTIARKLYSLNQLKLGKSRYPQIWMVTGIQLFQEVRIKSGSGTSSKAVFKATVPIPEPISGTAMTLLGQGTLGVEATRSDNSEGTVEYSHKDERVWAAQFMRLRVKFHKEGKEESTQSSRIELDELRNLGPQGMKGAQQDFGREFAEIDGLQDDGNTQEEVDDEYIEAMKGDWMLFQKLQQLEINKGFQNKRALLIGGAPGELQGIGRDLASMAELLIDRGFEVMICSENATRDGIFEAWHQLISQTVEHDTVVVYYSGHGVMGEPTATDDTTKFNEQWRLQCICPLDYEKTTEEDFRGIADIELSHLLNGLTARTKNVTLILDCCHSGNMARGPSETLRAKRFPKTHVGIANHIRRMQSKGVELGGLFVGGNPHAVRVFAAASDEVACEGLNSDKEHMGMLTDGLIRTIKDAGKHPVSWNTIILRIRDKLAISSPYQHPQLQGPWNRVLFSMDTVDPWGVLGLLVEKDGRAILRGGHVVGVGKGDVYAVMPFKAESIDSKEQIATAKVIKVYASTADVRLDYQNGHETVPEGAKAFPFTKPRHAVLVRGDDSFAKPFQSRLSNSKFVRDIDEGESETVPFATATQEGEILVLYNCKGKSIFKRNFSSKNALDDAICILENLARARHLLELDGSGREALPAKLDVEFGLVDDDGKPTKLPADNPLVREGDNVYLRLKNAGRSKVYVSVFDVNVSGSITMLSTGEAEGIELPGISAETQPRTYTLGQADFDDEIDGIEVRWPDSVPKDGSIDETLVIVVMNRPLDLRCLNTVQQEGVRNRSAIEMKDSSQLEQLAYQISNGVVMRDLVMKKRDDLRFHVHRVYFTLEPR